MYSNNLNYFNHADGELWQLLTSMQYELKTFKEQVINIIPKSQRAEKPQFNSTVPTGFMTSDEVLRRLKICRRTLYNYQKRGILSGKLIGGKYLYQQEDVDRLLKKK